MSIEKGVGSIFESGCEAIVIPVNCVGVAGKGLALAAKRRWPDWFADYKAHCDGRIRVGEVRFANRPIVPMVFNFPTKDHWRDPSRHAWIRDGLLDLESKTRPTKATRDMEATDGIKSIAIPALGCGAGGLAWSSVRPFIEAAFAGSPVRVVVYEPQGEHR